MIGKPFAGFLAGQIEHNAKRAEGMFALNPKVNFLYMDHKGNFVSDRKDARVMWIKTKYIPGKIFAVNLPQWDFAGLGGEYSWMEDSHV